MHGPSSQGVINWRRCALHQMANYVPLPGMPKAYQMTSHPSIPVQQPLLRNNPLVNTLRNLPGGNKIVQRRI